MGAQALFAQNLLTNGDFETIRQSPFPLVYGNNSHEEIPNWGNAARLTAGPYFGLQNLVQVDGPSGYDYAAWGPESDATAPGSGIDQHYIDGDSVNSFMLFQYFTPECSGDVVASASYSNRENSAGGAARLALVALGSQQQLPLQYGFGPMSASQAATLDALEAMLDANGVDISLPAGLTKTYNWQVLSTQPVSVQAGQTYVFITRYNNPTNVDNASVEYVSGGCSQEPPQVDVTKRCDPVQPVASGPMSLHCTITVTGSNLPAGSYVGLSDSFAGVTGLNAQSSGTMMNVTSSEPWNCTDLPGSPPNGSYGLCELSATDLAAAGGSSVVNVDFQFTADPAPGQAVNCAQVSSMDNAIVDLIHQGGRAPDAANRTGKIAGLGDNCAQIDVPAPIDDPKLPKPEKLGVSKSCNSPVATVRNGVSGFAWTCQINAVALPAPFVGTFTFDEDASGISGSTNAEIIGMTAGNPAWSCTLALPAQQTSCSISGADFATGGQETVVFDLFAEDQGSQVDWKNCVSGRYTAPDGQQRQLRGNCVDTGWKPPYSEPPRFDLKKSCQISGEFNGQVQYLCSIFITQTSGGPVTSPLTFDELFSNVQGTAATQYMAMLQGSPAGWLCEQPPFANGASCTISAADFNAGSNHRIDAMLLIPTGALAEQGFKNCAKISLKGNVVGKTCVDLPEPPEKPQPPKVEKTCKASGPRQQLSPQIWFQPYQCTITVVSQPFTGPLMLDDNMMYGTTSGLTSITAITSADPWACMPSPYGSPPANTPSCLIDGSQFPASGTSTLTVDLVLQGGYADMFGAENCVSLSTGKDNPVTVAKDCAPIADPLPPKLDVTKTCETATQSGAGMWDVTCTVTVTGQNLPFGQTIRISDEMFSAGQNNAVMGVLSSNAAGQCGGGLINNGFASSCDISTNDLMANGGSMSFDFSGRISGSGGMALGANRPYPQNCAFADVMPAAIHGPDNASGKVCVDIPLLLSAVPPIGPIGTPIGNPTPIGDPVDPNDPGTGGNEPDCSVDTLYVMDVSGSMASQNRMNLARSSVIAALGVFEGGGSSAGLIKFNNNAHTLVSPMETLPSANILNQLNGLSPGGGTNWLGALTEINAYIGALPQKPLIFFVTDGVPMPSYGTTAQMQAEVAAIRAQGSRVIAIGIGPNIPSSQLMAVFGSSLVTVTSSTVVDPFQTDVIMLPNVSQSVSAFTQIANAYCPDQNGIRDARRDSLLQLLQNMPKSSGIYMGDDILPEDVANVPVGQPELAVFKEQTGFCKANRDSQQYSCGFRIGVTNTGNRPYRGPAAVVDKAGKPGIASARVMSGNGWDCNRVAGVLACSNDRVELMPGQSSYIDLQVKVPGVRRGGRLQNCAILGVPENRTQRVAIAQQIMNRRGLGAGPVDGKPGRRTYAALSALRTGLGLPVSRKFNDRLFAALGFKVGKGPQDCVSVNLDPMPAPPLQCDPATTTPLGESCACRYDSMRPLSKTRCGCPEGTALVAGKGCVKQEPVLQCDRRSTYPQGGECACIDPRGAVKTSPGTCGCRNGLPMVNGHCLPVQVKPQTGEAGTDNCRLRVNGVCLN